jgi:pimeloyl-ACP methyl ester carboxylesterase
MGGLTGIEYVLTHPQHKVRALVLASTSGSIDRSSVPLADPQYLTRWEREAGAARADMQRRGVSPAAGERMAREQPELHFLYRAIANASASFDREALRKRNKAMCVHPSDVLRGFSMPTLFRHWRGRHDISAIHCGCTRHLDAEREGRAGARHGALCLFRAGVDL